MAAGDIVFFANWRADVQRKLHDMDLDTFKVGHITSAVTPARGTPDPRWGAGGATNLATNEVPAGGNYVAGGPVAANPTVTIVAETAVWDADDIAIAQDAANPTTSRWGIIYNDTDPGKRCVGFVDLGNTINMTSGNYSITWNVLGIAILD